MSTMTEAKDAVPTVPGRLVWDLPIRVVHWVVLAAVIGCYVTDKLGPSYFTWHLACGCTVLVLVIFRILWGFVGTRHARFKSFLRGPRDVLRYLRGQPPGGGAFAVVGHNPLGGAGIVVMLLLLLTQATTGLFSNDDIVNVGPFFGWVSDKLSYRMTYVHHLTFQMLEVMIGVHVAAVLYHQFVKRSNLIGPMFSGRKPADAVHSGEEISGSRLWLAAAIVITLTLILIYLVRTAPVASLSPF